MYGFEHVAKHDQTLPRDADGFLRLSDSPSDASVEIQGLVNRAHALRGAYMAETIKVLGRSIRGRLRASGGILRTLPSNQPLNRFGQSPNWF